MRWRVLVSFKPIDFLKRMGLDGIRVIGKVDVCSGCGLDTCIPTICLPHRLEQRGGSASRGGYIRWIHVKPRTAADEVLVLPKFMLAGSHRILKHHVVYSVIHHDERTLADEHWAYAAHNNMHALKKNTHANTLALQNDFFGLKRNHKMVESNQYKRFRPVPSNCRLHRSA